MHLARLAPSLQRPCSRTNAQTDRMCAQAGFSSGSCQAHVGRCQSPGFRRSAGMTSSRNSSSSVWGNKLHGYENASVRGCAMVAAAAKQPSSSRNRSSSSRSSSPAQLCPLHECLVRHGITNLAAFSSPRHLALRKKAVSSDVEPKLAALARLGVRRKQVLQILKALNSPLWCSYADVFQPNLQLLQQVAEYMDHRPDPGAPWVSPAGVVLAGAPAAAARYLSCDPDKVQQLLRWLESSLGIGLHQLAACNSLSSALVVPADAATAVWEMLGKEGVPADRMAHMFLTQPAVFKRSPALLSARISALEQLLGLNSGDALRMAVEHPGLLNSDLKANLPPLLRFLDSYMGEEGAGHRLVRAQPSLGALTAKAAERCIGSLAARGCGKQRIQAAISKQPILLTLKLDSAVQQQKLDWIQRASPWALDVFLATPAYLAFSTRRLEARLALLHECGLQMPRTPEAPMAYTDARFVRLVRKLSARQGRDWPGCRNMEEWETWWLDSLDEAQDDW